jgi:hypothetical protein
MIAAIHLTILMGGIFDLIIATGPLKLSFKPVCGKGSLRLCICFHSKHIFDKYSNQTSMLFYFP